MLYLSWPGTHDIAQIVLELWQCSCLSLSSAGTTSISQHVWLKIHFFFLRCTILSLDKQYVTTIQTIKYRIFSSSKNICLPQTSHHLHPFPRGNHWSDSVPIILSSLGEKNGLYSLIGLLFQAHITMPLNFMLHMFSAALLNVCVLQSAVWGVRQGLSCSVTQAGFELQDTWGETYQLGTVLHKLLDSGPLVLYLAELTLPHRRQVITSLQISLYDYYSNLPQRKECFLCWILTD